VSVRINTNIEALNAQRNLTATSLTFAKSVEKLSSGLRINRAADDAAGLAISEKLQAQVTSLNQAQRNAQDGISMVQTAEGALNEVHSMLQRIRELAVEAANSTLSSSDAQSVATEITALRAEINRIAGATTFNGQNLLTGALSVSQSGGTVIVGSALNTGHNSSVSAVDVSGAKASTTYTITSQAGGKVTLSDGVLSQQVTLDGTIGADGTEVVNFGNMGVKLTIVGDSAKTAADLATDLAAPGATAPTSVLGGNTATNVVTGDYLMLPHPASGVTYDAVTGLDDSGGATPLTSTGSASVTPGSGVLSVDGAGNVSVTVNGEAYTGTLAAISSGAASHVTLTAVSGRRIELGYTQGSAATLAGEVASMNGATINVDGSLQSGAWVSSVSVAPSTTAGTYTFTSTAAGTLTLSGPGGSQTVAVAGFAAGGSSTLDFDTLGISVGISDADENFSADAIISNLLMPANGTIVITTSGGSGGGPGTVITGAGTGANFQVGANAGDFLGVSFADAQITAAGYGSWNADITAFQTATNSGSGIVGAAQALITSSDTAIGYISTTRGNLGAIQNRLEHTTASISVAAENLNASQSRIRDLDVASEMVTFTKTQILQQAGTAILAQANSAPQNILTLLRG
jgi:flagellin